MISMLSMVFATVAPEFRADPAPVITVEAEIRSNELGSRFGPTLAVRLVSGEKEVAVVTESLSVKIAKDGRRVTVRMAMVEKKEHKGRVVVPSVNKLGVVKLHPNEVATVYVPTSPDLPAILKEAMAEKIDLFVEYEVSEFWGKRFDVVHGVYRGAVTVPK